MFAASPNEARKMD